MWTSRFELPNSDLANRSNLDGAWVNTSEETVALQFGGGTVNLLEDVPFYSTPKVYYQGVVDAGGANGS